MRISDWSSDVCSSDLLVEKHPDEVGPNVTANVKLGLTFSATDVAAAAAAQTRLYHGFLDFMERHDALVCPVASVQPFDKTELKIGRASCRERGWQYG